MTQLVAVEVDQELSQPRVGGSEIDFHFGVFPRTHTGIQPVNKETSPLCMHRQSSDKAVMAVLTMMTGTISIELNKINVHKKASHITCTNNNPDTANLSEMTRPPVRLAPSMVKQQSCRGSGRGFCKVTSAASLRFCLGSPRTCRTQPTLEKQLAPSKCRCLQSHCLSTYSDFDFRILQDDISDCQRRFSSAVVQQQNRQAD